LIIISGRNEKLPGHPLVYGTSKNFMDYFGINSADDLPKIKEVLADQIVEPTRIHHTNFEQSESLLVSEEGELVNVNTENGNEEDHVNGHSFDMEVEEESVSKSSDGNATEDLPSEEAKEEFIADETFIEGDEIEAAEDAKEEISNEEDSSGESSEEGTNDDDSDNESANDKDNEEQDEK